MKFSRSIGTTALPRSTLLSAITGRKKISRASATSSSQRTLSITLLLSTYSRENLWSFCPKNVGGKSRRRFTTFLMGVQPGIKTVKFLQICATIFWTLGYMQSGTSSRHLMLFFCYFQNSSKIHSNINLLTLIKVSLLAMGATL